MGLAFLGALLGATAFAGAAGCGMTEAPIESDEDVTTGPPGASIPASDASLPPPTTGTDAGVPTADGSSGPGDAGGPQTFTVLSFNVLHGFPSGENLDARTKITVDAIKKYAPDVALLQEIAQSALQPNRAGVLASMTGYEWHWTKASGVPAVFEEGPGVLSKWPIVWKDGLELPHKTNFGLAGRSVCAVRVKAPFGEVQAFSVHLENTGEDTIRADQAKATLEYMAAHPSPLPGFLAGDMNALPDELAMKVLRGEATHNGTTGNLVDAWKTVLPADPGFTAPNPNPTQRIDYVYAVPGAKTATVEKCEKVLEAPVGGVHASDHIGVLCTFKIP